MAYQYLLTLGYCLTWVWCSSCADSNAAKRPPDCAKARCASLPDASQQETADATPPTSDLADASSHGPDAALGQPTGPLGGEPGYGFVPGEPFALPELGQDFVFVPIAGTVCQDGSTSGIAVKRGSAELLIYLEGGGACFNDWTCLSSSTLFASRSFGAADLKRVPTQGICC